MLTTGTKWMFCVCMPTKMSSRSSIRWASWGGPSFLKHFLNASYSFSSVQSLSHVRLFATPQTAARQASLSITNTDIHSNPWPSSRWCHPAISSSVVPFSSCPQSFPASRSFQMSQLFASSGQSIGVSASASVLPMNVQDWSPLGWAGWISLQSKGLSRVFFNTIVQKHQLFCAQLYLWSNSHIQTWPLEKLCWHSNVSAF